MTLARLSLQVPPEQEEKLQLLLHSQKEAGQQTLYHLPHMNLWTKLRPGVRVSQLSAPRLETHHVLAGLSADTSGLMPKEKALPPVRPVSGHDSSIQRHCHPDI